MVAVVAMLPRMRSSMAVRTLTSLGLKPVKSCLVTRPNTGAWTHGKPAATLGCEEGHGSSAAGNAATDDAAHAMRETAANP
jgi:hypothetical protein